jgi:hypothetical protein
MQLLGIVTPIVWAFTSKRNMRNLEGVEYKKTRKKMIVWSIVGSTAVLSFMGSVLMRRNSCMPLMPMPVIVF